MTTNVSLASHLKAPSTSLGHPGVATKRRREGSRTIELGTILVIPWSLEHGVRFAVNIAAVLLISASAGTATTVPVSGRRGLLGFGHGHGSEEHDDCSESKPHIDL